MAESTLKFQGWSNEFYTCEFAVFWLIMETVLEEAEIERGPGSLDFRLRNLIEEGDLGADWYHIVELDDVIGADAGRFDSLLAKADLHVMSHRPEELWGSLKRPGLAHEVGHAYFGDPPNPGALQALILRFSLPWLSPPEDSKLVKAVGWIRTVKRPPVQS
jgi:hypothetical protein